KKHQRTPPSIRGNRTGPASTLGHEARTDDFSHLTGVRTPGISAEPGAKCRAASRDHRARMGSAFRSADESHRGVHQPAAPEDLARGRTQNHHKKHTPRVLYTREHRD